MRCVKWVEKQSAESSQVPDVKRVTERRLMSDEEYSTFEAKAEILRTGSDVMERQERESYEGCEYEVAETAYLKRRAADLEGMRSKA
jgi:hypothetical protein